MLGTFRLLLAILVALSHANLQIAGLNPGVIAVVGFYLISGYVMTGLLRKHYHRVEKIPYFYVDRALRLFPQYLFIASLTLMWLLIVGKHTDFLQHTPQFSDLLSNFFVIPLNYFMFNDTGEFTLIPPAWSLGAEIQFYILIPLLIWWRVRWGGFLIALTIFILAACTVINTDYYAYRLLPGVLVFFLLGSWMFDISTDKKKPLIFCGVVIALTALFAILLHKNQWLSAPYNMETLLGIAIGVPALAFLGTLKQHHLDNRLGDLSYGVFLNHFLLQWAILGVPKTKMEILIYIALSVIFSYATQKMIESPVISLRNKLRKL